MSDLYEPHRLAGYFLTRPFSRPAYTSSELLPERLVSLSGCLAESVPDTWSLAWANMTEAQRHADAAAFGVSPSSIPGLVAWATEEFDKSWGWPNVLYSLDTARFLYSQFLSSVPDVRLLGLALPEHLAPRFVAEATPLPTEGDTGFLTLVRAGAQLAPTGVILGWEILGFEHGSFHSWLCNGLQVHVFSELLIRPGPNSLIQEAQAAYRAAEYCGQPAVAAEPAFWLPGLIVEYSLPGGSGAAA